MTEPREEKWTFTSFPLLLSDAIAFDRLANDASADDHPKKNRYAKASFLNAVLAIECAANCCLARLGRPFSEKAIEWLDKATVLDKYEILLFGKTGKHLDFGSEECQPIKDLITFRNNHVHPKIRTRELKVTRTGPQEHTYEEMKDVGTSQFLKLPKDMDAWTGEHSRAIVKAALQFFNYFFINQCQMKTDEINRLLSTISMPSGTTFQENAASEQFAEVQAIYKTKILFLTLAGGSGHPEQNPQTTGKPLARPKRTTPASTPPPPSSKTE